MTLEVDFQLLLLAANLALLAASLAIQARARRLHKGIRRMLAEAKQATLSGGEEVRLEPGGCFTLAPGESRTFVIEIPADAWKWPR
jgi:hypothetical protein